MADFFISHNRADRTWAEWIAWQLEDAGYQVILQEWDFRPGQNFMLEMQRALAKADRVVAVLSPSYLTGEFSQAEWAAHLVQDASGVDGKLLVVRVRECEPPGLLSPIIRIDLFGIPEEDAREMLLAGVKKGRVKPLVKPDFPVDGPSGTTTGHDRAPFPLEVQRERTAVAVDAHLQEAAESALDRRSRPGRKVVGLPVSAGVEGFKDRDVLRKELGRLLAAPTTRMVSVVGRRGIGKSALAAKVLGDLERDRWPHVDEEIPVDGIAYISTRTRTKEITLERIFLDCAQLLGGEAQKELLHVWTSPHRTVAEKAEVLLDALSDGLYVILLDNMEDILTEDGRLRDPELQTFFDVAFLARHCPRFLITSQRPITLAPELLKFDVRVRLVDGLPEEDAAQLLRELDVSGEAGLRDKPDEDLRRAAKAVHGVPRALELLAAILANGAETLDDLVKTFAEREDVLGELVEKEYRTLDDDARHVVHALAAFGRPVGADALEWVVGCFAPGIDLDPVVARLVRTNVVSRDPSTRRISLHPLDSDFAYKELPVSGSYSREAFDLRIAEWYAATRLPEEKWQTIDDINPQLLEFEHRLRANDVSTATRILCSINDFLVWHGSVARAEAMHQAVGERIDDARLRAEQLGRFGLVRLIGGPMETAKPILEQAQALAAEVGDRQTEGRALHLLGELARLDRRLDEAVSLCRRAADLQHEHAAPRDAAHALQGLALALIYRGDLAEAFQVAERVASMAEASADAEVAARAMDLRSLANLAGGRFSEALSYASDAMERYLEAIRPDALAYLYNTKGLAYLGMGRLGDAVDAFERGRTEGALGNSPRVEGLCLFNLACAHWLAGRNHDAADAVASAVPLLKRHGDCDAATAAALHAAISAVSSGASERAPRLFLVAARSAVGNAELYPGEALAREALRLAEEVGLPDVAAEAAELARTSPGAVSSPHR